MPHEIDKEALTAHLDGRGTPETAAHLASCRECAAYLERVRKAADLFKRHGAVPAPVSSRTYEKTVTISFGFRWAAVAAALLVGVVAGGWALRRYMPGLFSTLQGAISGAANEMGK